MHAFWETVALLEPEELESFRAALCAMHQLWMATPLSLQMPLTCHDGFDQTGNYLAWRRIEAPLHLAHFPLVGQKMLMRPYPSQSIHPAATVALATVAAYAAATYGPERIPILIGEASRHESWATLIPAVFGVSVDEFETGWRAYLAERYGVRP
jgi:hypothetical protein